MINDNDLPKSASDLVIITAHRGMGVSEKPRHQFFCDSKFYPENSLEAFAAAIEHGVSSIECDIHVSKDGKAMVIHGSKIAPYADLISSAGISSFPTSTIDQCMLCLAEKRGNSKPPSIADLLRIERFSAQELQSCFALKTFDTEALVKKKRKNSKANTGSTWKLFDAQNSKVKSDLPAYVKKTIAKIKYEALKRNPRRNQIPMLSQLLHLVYDTNKARAGRHQPNIKLNIELKGEGSAIASIVSILQFYKNYPDAEQYIKPENIIFLGRREVGEISIANAILKNQVKTAAPCHFEVPELFNHYIETQTTLNAQLKNDYSKNSLIINGMRMLLDGCVPFNHPAFDEYNRGHVLLLAYSRAGGKPEKFEEFLTSVNERYPSIENYALLKKVEFHLKDISKIGSTTEAIKGLWKKEFGSNGHPALTSLIRSMQANTTEREYLEKKMRPYFSKTQQTLLNQIRNILECKNQAEIESALDNIYKKLSNCKTTLMLSTGDLFDTTNVIDDDFNIKEGITEINKKAERTIIEALVEYKYEGIDISLFDYCDSLISALERAIQDGNLDRTRLILGATASNWRASKIESTGDNKFDPYNVPARALHITKKIKLPLLVKVDEPGGFKHLKNEIVKQIDNGTGVEDDNKPGPYSAIITRQESKVFNHEDEPSTKAPYNLFYSTSLITPPVSGAGKKKELYLAIYAEVDFNPLSERPKEKSLATLSMYQTNSFLYCSSVLDNSLFTANNVQIEKDISPNGELLPGRKPPRGISPALSKIANISSDAQSLSGKYHLTPRAL